MKGPLSIVVGVVELAAVGQGVLERLERLHMSSRPGLRSLPVHVLMSHAVEDGRMVREVRDEAVEEDSHAKEALHLLETGREGQTCDSFDTRG